MSNREGGSYSDRNGGNVVAAFALLALFALATEMLRWMEESSYPAEQPTREVIQPYIRSARMAFFKAHFADPVPACALSDAPIFRQADMDRSRPVGVIPCGVADGRDPHETVREALFLVDQDAHPQIVLGLRQGYLTGECLVVESSVGALTPIRIQEVTNSVIGQAGESL